MHNADMPSITIRNVPKEVRDALAARAARGGRSMQEHLLAELKRLALRPSNAEIIERIRARVEASGKGLTARQILAARDDGRNRR